MNVIQLAKGMEIATQVVRMLCELHSRHAELQQQGKAAEVQRDLWREESARLRAMGDQRLEEREQCLRAVEALERQAASILSQAVHLQEVLGECAEVDAILGAWNDLVDVQIELARGLAAAAEPPAATPVALNLAEAIKPVTVVKGVRFG